MTGILIVGLFLSATAFSEEKVIAGEKIVIHEEAQYLVYRSNGLPTDQIRVFRCGEAQSTLLKLGGPPAGSIIVDNRSLHYLAKGRLFSHELATGKMQDMARPDLLSLDDFYQIGTRTVMLTTSSNRELTISVDQGGATRRRTSIPMQDIGPYKGSTRQGDKVFFFFSHGSGYLTVNLMYSISTGRIVRVDDQKIMLNCGVTLQGSDVLCGPSNSFRLRLDSALTGFWSTKEAFVIETANRLYLYKKDTSGVLLHNESDQSPVDIALLSCGSYIFDGKNGRWYSESGAVPE